ncbi:hypothetical protein RDI58_022279 [Solanum bulbocastanum]|uniref:Uncharacterized protein n=1 Tax=Solanum bulbocastanum TaxID=147425 RepID=A0AAN8T1S1_SOLBU
MGDLDLCRSGELGLRRSGDLDLRRSGDLDLRRSGDLDLRRNGECLRYLAGEGDLRCTREVDLRLCLGGEWDCRGECFLQGETEHFGAERYALSDETEQCLLSSGDPDVLRDLCLSL